ncbi:MAG: hypothetical protein ACMG51_06445 [Ginsengibacter sp.]
MKLMKFLTFVLATFLSMVLITSCSKEYSLENGNGGKTATGTWEFNDSIKGYQGNIDTAYILGTGSNKELHLVGPSLTGNQNFNLVLYSDTFKVGSYKASLFQSSFDFSSGGKSIYKAGQVYGEFIVNITSYNKQLIIGTFSGSVRDSTNKTTSLKLGKFISILADSSAAPTSAGVLGDSVGNCKPVTLNGNYTQAIALNSINTVQVQATVTVPGTYKIFTDPVNGVSFSGTGNFTSAGVKTIILSGSGTPAFGGNQTFTLHFGTSQCGFTINFQNGTTLLNDYYPFTPNNDWTYGDSNPSDSFLFKILPTPKVINSNSYSVMGDYDLNPQVFFDTVGYYRKVGNNYYNYTDISETVNFDNPQYLELIILKDNMPSGSTWQSATVNGTISSLPASVYVKFTILAKSVPVSIGSFNFPDVIKIKSETYLNNVLYQTQESWYANRVGLIYISTTKGVTTDIFEIGNYHIF